MSWADWLVVALTVQYAAVGVLYGRQGDWWRLVYWLGAVAINVAILRLGR